MTALPPTRHLDPEALSLAERYKLLIGAIVPRPIAFVSTVDPGGRTNLAPYSFFNGVGSNPMLLMFCPANDLDGTDKDSLRNAAPEAEGGTGCFVVNTASEPYAAAVSMAAEPLPHGESEFDLTGLTPVACETVPAPRVAEAPVAFACRTHQIVRTNPGEPAGGNIVIGRVVEIHVRPALVNERMHVDPEALAAVGRMGGPDFCRTRERFAIPRGRAAADATLPF